jgi:Nif-specific regulatory protein
VLQERVIERLGGRKVIPLDVRILAATNKDLEVAIKKGTFREDLYFRLKVIHIHMPSLREIHEDIPLLANSLLAAYCQEMQKATKKLGPGALRCLMAYSWPGNVRELENEMKRAAVLSEGNVVTEDDFSEAVRTSSNKKGFTQLSLAGSLKETVATLEKRLIAEALQARQQNQQQAAKMLGLSRQGLIKKMKRYGIKAA